MSDVDVSSIVNGLGTALNVKADEEVKKVHALQVKNISLHCRPFNIIKM